MLSEFIMIIFTSRIVSQQTISVVEYHRNSMTGIRHSNISSNQIRRTTNLGVLLNGLMPPTGVPATNPSLYIGVAYQVTSILMKGAVPSMLTT